MSFNTLTIPSIAGAPNVCWKSYFCPGVTRYDMIGTESLPMEGSVGICFSIEEDMRALWGRLGEDKGTIAVHLGHIVCPPPPGFKGEPKPITARQIAQVLDFMDLALGSQPYFFLRKGRKTFGLYRKTKDYYYEPTNPHPHRIGFEFVRLANEHEQNNFRVGSVPQTVLMVTAFMPITPVAVEDNIEDLMSSLSVLRGALANLTSDLDAAVQRFTEALA